MVGGEDLYCDCCRDPPEAHRLLVPSSPLPWLATDNSSISDVSDFGSAPPLPHRNAPAKPPRASYGSLGKGQSFPDRVPRRQCPVTCPCDSCCCSHPEDDESLYEEVGFQYYPSNTSSLQHTYHDSSPRHTPESDDITRRGGAVTTGLVGTDTVIFPGAVFPLKPPRTSAAAVGVGGVLRSLGVCGRPSSRATEEETVSTYTLEDDLTPTHSRKVRPRAKVTLHNLVSPCLNSIAAGSAYSHLNCMS
ncbi:hypothetical protein Pmani_027512 [Petrolisthes manimaculis]|uniref:Uncharacterized protein n=1 Tax=Petrolisthes manimaculis TaxID=1843537 RepID=A0AAE1P1Z4_9EUCA|nr:hypothetical protein Pmani_027512 [Petrolisthes manimaculis]